MLETCKRKTLITAADIKGDLNEWEDMPYSRIGRFNIKKVFFAISIKIPSSCSFFSPPVLVVCKAKWTEKKPSKMSRETLKKDKEYRSGRS